MMILTSSKPKKQTPSEESTATFCLDLLTTITLVNKQRVVWLWYVN